MPGNHEQMLTAHTWPTRSTSPTVLQRFYSAVTGSHQNSVDDRTNLPLYETSRRHSPSPSYSLHSRSNSPDSFAPKSSGAEVVTTNGDTVVKRHSGRVLFRYWIHVLAIACTAAIATINFLNLYLMDVDNPNAQVILEAFQFVAKAHELIIMGSLVLVIMDLIRSQIIRQSGVPLGLLLANVLFTDLEWLSSSEFWGCLKFRGSGLPLTLLVLVAIPFANLAGPLSAVTIVPRLGWSQSHPAQLFPYFFNGSASDLWPDAVSAASLPPACFNTSGEKILACPASVLYSPTDFGNPLACTSSGWELSCNGTMNLEYNGGPQDPGIARPMSAELSINEETVYSSTPTRLVWLTLSNRISNGLALTLNISDTEAIDALKIQLIDANFLGNQQMFKPLVKATCASLSSVQAQQMISERHLPNTFGDGSVTFLEDITSSNAPNLLFTVNKKSRYLPYYMRGNCTGDGCYAAFTCTADAKWVPFRAWYNTAQSTVIFQNDPQPKALFESDGPQGTRSVVVKKDYLNALINPQAKINDSVINFDGSLVWPIWSYNWSPYFEGSPPKTEPKQNTQQSYQATNYTQALAMQFSTILSEALARYPSIAGSSSYDGNCSDAAQDFTFSKRICAKNPSHWINAKSLGDLANTFSAMTFTTQKSGYRWGFDSALVIVSLAALLFHALLTLTYLTVVMAFRKRITTCWSSGPEMLMLAINSVKAPVLMGHSTGASSHERHLWLEPVTVREVEGGEELSLVVGDPASYSGQVGDLPRVGKKYN